MKKTLILFLLFLYSCDTPQKYIVTGIIKQIDKDKNRLLIDHDLIPGFMDPMIMYFNIHNSTNIQKFEINDSVKFDLVVNKTDSYTLNYTILGKANNNTDDSFWDDDEESKYKLKNAGDHIDDVSFLDIDGNEIILSDFTDTYSVISFIFSRCPMPNMCPASIIKNQYLAKHFKDINFILISFDYIYDTPKVLKNIYGDLNKDNVYFFSSYKHLNDLFMLTQQSGVGFWGVEENNIGHSMRTIVIDKNLKLIKTFDGMDWKPGDAKRDLENLIKIHN